MKERKVKEQNGEREKFNQTNKTNKQNKLNQNYYTISYLRLLCFVEFAILISHLPSQFNSNQKKTSSIFFLFTLLYLFLSFFLLLRLLFNYSTHIKFTIYNGYRCNC
ncbi:hypothetical protein MGS_05297 [Candida albicans P78042]|nr:hypothetical protein MG7_05252 [Candida albicans P34048]KGU22851.1 hypothetical protein MGK_05256 [Candida albicans P57055]KHC67915.1 hypothetical protein MGS_05297 [Candida albicans P78042]